MTDLAAALQDVADQLNTAGISAAVDPRDLTLPGVWPTPALLDFDRLDANTWTLELELLVVTRNNGDTQALNDLSIILDQLRALWNVPEAQAATVDLPNHGGKLPALIVPLTIQVSEE